MFARYRHVQLLWVLSLLLLLTPFLEHSVSFAVVDVLLGVTLVSAVSACATNRRQLVTGVVLMLPMQAIVLLRSFDVVTPPNLEIAHAGLGVIFFGYIAALIMADVFRKTTHVSTDTICGALAAYLLIGVAWSFAYALLNLLVPGSIEGLLQGERPGSFDGYLGYSFVTLTTLGYGNVVPANARADALAVAEAIVGQVYLTVLVARLVALNLASALSRRDDESKGKPA